MSGVSASRPGPEPGVRRPSRSGRARLLGVAVLAVPIAELALLVVVGRAFGGLVLLGLLAAAAAGGVLVLRRIGSAAARRLASRRGMVVNGVTVDGLPAPEGPPPADTALLAVAGVLLVVPGFLGDAVGLALLVPRVRRAAVARLGEALTRRISRGAVRIVPGDLVIRGEAYAPAPGEPFGAVPGHPFGPVPGHPFGPVPGHSFDPVPGRSFDPVPGYGTPGGGRGPAPAVLSGDVIASRPTSEDDAPPRT